MKPVTIASVRAHGDTPFLVLYLMVIGALLIAEMPRNETNPVAIEDKAPVAKEDKAPVAKEDKAPFGA